MTEAPFDVTRAHRWFGVEFNNQAWEIAEAAERGPEQIEQMIHMAHAACIHWLQVGTALNHQRAQNLLAYAYLTAGHAERALHHARKCVELSDANAGDQTPFDRATAYGVSALAYLLANDPQRADHFDQLARATAAKLTDPDDLSVFAKLFPK